MMILLHTRDLLVCFILLLFVEKSNDFTIFPTLIDDDGTSGCWFVTPISHRGATMAASSHCCFIHPGKTNYNV